MILAIESASTDLSVAVAGPDGATLATDAWSSDRRQAHELLPRMLEMLNRAGLALADSRAVAVGLGPGSFTGLRVGVSVAKGIAFALKLPIVGVPSLQAWLAAEPGCGVAMARAGAADVYLLARDAAGPIVVERAALAGLSGTIAARELASDFALLDTRPPDRAAAAVARLGAGRLAEDPSGDDLERLEPSYLRGPRGIGMVGEGAIQWL
ncbi:MAG: tRNA (adenosine(37)-N6)-threonylcarbamoyltransferase complex dimerization subunit type 1 TsaB [Chloroflexota bacterium]|nr:tRNA (adenosine(37)-N6)-threonylcarbamoyltransferase complex dimerization subunit type 1 TsaB [Chloroflexota bacterium]